MTLAVLIEPEAVLEVEVDASGGLTTSAWENDRRTPPPDIFQAHLLARHAGFAAERLFLGSAWMAGAYDILQIRRLYAAGKRQPIDLAVMHELIGSPRTPRQFAAQPIPEYVAHADAVVRLHDAEIACFARRLLKGLPALGTWDALSRCSGIPLDRASD